MEKPAPTDRPIHEIIRRRWSPRAFSERPVSKEILATIFEAARWAPSCYNDQPWRFLVAAMDDPEGLARMRGLLVEGNAWARRAPVLVLSLARTAFLHNGKPNLHAWHDVGAAGENLALEAIHQGLFAHPMGGFKRDEARKALAIPAGWEPVAMIALGYPGSPDDLAEDRRAAETAPRARKPLSEIVNGARFGEPFED